MFIRYLQQLWCDLTSECPPLGDYTARRPARPFRNAHGEPAGLAPEPVERQKGYWIAHIDVTDPQRYPLYCDVNEDAFARFGGRYLVRGGQQSVTEGCLKKRTVIVEFDSLDAATKCYESIENVAAKALRTSISLGDLVIVEGAGDLG